MATDPIWGTPCDYVTFNHERTSDYVEHSPRSGGNYELTKHAQWNNDVLLDKVKARLTTWVIDQQAEGVRFPLIDQQQIDKAHTREPLSVSVRADRLLKFLASESPTAGATLSLRDGGRQPPAANPLFMSALAWSESTTSKEIRYLVEYLKEKKWVRERPAFYHDRRTGKMVQSDNTLTGNLEVTVSGHEQVETLKTETASWLCFVAMWLDDSMDNVYDDAIELAIRDAQYKPIRIDKKRDLVNRIDDAILANIRDSHFLVADLTHGKEGARGSVYYEIGYAHALGKDVVFTCREDMFEEAQRTFDIRQYHTIKWTDNNVSQLRAELNERIEQTFGKGTYKGE